MGRGNADTNIDVSTLWSTYHKYSCESHSCIRPESLHPLIPNQVNGHPTGQIKVTSDIYLLEC